MVKNQNHPDFILESGLLIDVNRQLVHLKDNFSVTHILSRSE